MIGTLIGVILALIVLGVIIWGVMEILKVIPLPASHRHDRARAAGDRLRPDRRVRDRHVAGGGGRARPRVSDALIAAHSRLHLRGRLLSAPTAEDPMRSLALILLAPLLVGCSTVPRDLLSGQNVVTNAKTGKPVVVKRRAAQRSVKRVAPAKTAAPPKAAPAPSQPPAAAPPKKLRWWQRRPWRRAPAA